MEIEQLSLFDSQVEVVEPVRVEPSYELTPRQWALYRLIKANTLRGRKTTQREICNEIPEYEWVDNDKVHDHCSSIWGDINALNFHPNIQKTIISDNFEYWIGSEKEVEAYCDKLWQAISPRLSRYWNIVKKMKLDGQGQIFSARGDLIDEDSKARSYIESFIN